MLRTPDFCRTGAINLDIVTIFLLHKQQSTVASSQQWAAVSSNHQSTVASRQHAGAKHPLREASPRSSGDWFITAWPQASKVTIAPCVLVTLKTPNTHATQRARRHMHATQRTAPQCAALMDYNRRNMIPMSTESVGFRKKSRGGRCKQAEGFGELRPPCPLRALLQRLCPSRADCHEHQQQSVDSRLSSRSQVSTNSKYYLVAKISTGRRTNGV